MSISPPSRFVRLSSFLALERSTVAVLAMAVLVGMGERMAERFLPIYMMALGGGALSIGLLNGMDNLLSALYAFPGGYLSDRIGTRRALAVFTLVAMAGFAIVILIPSWKAVLAGAVLFISWSAISQPATVNLIYQVLPQHKRTMGVTMHSLVRRVPMALGPVAGGACIAAWGEEKGVRIAFAIALVLAAVALVVQQRLIAEPAGQPDNRQCREPFRALFGLMPPEMKSLLLTDILIRFCEQIPYAFVVVWAMKVIAEPVSALEFGLLTTIEMITAVVVYIPVAYLADKSTKKPYVLATFVFFTLFPLVLMWCRSFSWLLAAFFIRGLKEFGEPTRKSLIMDLAPDNCKAAMFGLYYLIRDIIVAIAAVGGAFLWQISPELNLIVAFAFGVIGTTAFALFGKDQVSVGPYSNSLSR